MKRSRKALLGVAVYPRGAVERRQLITVGLWTHLTMSEVQRNDFFRVFRDGVTRDHTVKIIEHRNGSSTIELTLRVSTQREKRMSATFLAKVFRSLTRAMTLVRELPSQEQVLKTLAPS